jgi:hypothetical protein
LCEDGLYGSFCDLGRVIGNDGSNEFYEEINIVDVTSEIERAGLQNGTPCRADI